MKQFKFFAVALAALTMFSCSKDNINDPEGPTNGKTMEIKIAGSGLKQGVRNVGTPQAAGYQTSISNGKVDIYCFDGNQDGATLLYQTETVSLKGDLAKGYIGVAQGIPSTTKYVYVVANTTRSNDSAGTTTLGDVKAMSKKTTDYQDISKTPMTNIEGGNVEEDAQNSGKLIASVTLAPAMARIELKKVKGSGEITEFNLVGVYLDNYYPSFTLNGAADGMIVPPVTVGTTLPTNGQVWWYDIRNGSGALEYTANSNANTEVWNYMIAPGQTPKIILKLSDVKIGGSSSTLNYVTVKSFKNTTDQSIISSFDRNMIYKIESISFDDTNITIDPNQESVELTVNVSIKAWTSTDITPDL